MRLDPLRWIFSVDDIVNTPSRLDGISASDETIQRCQSANMIEALGRKLQLPSTAIYSAAVYMQRFYQMHSCVQFSPLLMAPVFLLLAAKVEECPRSVHQMILGYHKLRHPDERPLRVESELYLQKYEEIVMWETVLIQSLGFEFTLDNPYAYVAQICQRVDAPLAVSQTVAYLLKVALLYTPICIRYRANVVASVAFQCALKWIDVIIEPLPGGKRWYETVIVDKSGSTMSLEALEAACNDFLGYLAAVPRSHAKFMRPDVYAYKSRSYSNRRTHATVATGTGRAAASSLNAKPIRPMNSNV